MMYYEKNIDSGILDLSGIYNQSGRLESPSDIVSVVFPDPFEYNLSAFSLLGVVQEEVPCRVTSLERSSSMEFGRMFSTCMILKVVLFSILMFLL